MTSEAPFLQCRQCGIRYRSDKVTEHDNICSQVANLQVSGNETSNSGATAKQSNFIEQMNAIREKLKSDDLSKDRSGSLPNLNEGGNVIRDRFGSYAVPLQSDEGEFVSPSDVSGVTSEFGEDSAKYVRSKSSKIYRDKVDIQMAGGSNTNLDRGTHHEDFNTAQEDSFGKVDKSIGNSGTGATEKRDDPSENVASKNENGKNDDAKKMEDSPYPSTSGSEQVEEVAKLEEDRKKPEKDDGGLSALMKDQQQFAKQQEVFKKRRETLRRSSSPDPKHGHMDRKGSSSEESQEEFLESLPVLSPQVERAYQQHRKSLVPCKHCDRKFVPDRLSVHQKSCIKRPKTREYITPDKK